MFAVIKAGGKQYRVAANDLITLDRLKGEPGDVIAFSDVILFGNDGKTEFGAPTVAGVTVAAEVVEQVRGPKVIAFKKRRRQNSKRKRGHRQLSTVLRITEILTGGEKPKATAKSAATAESPTVEAQASVAEAEAPAPKAKAPAKAQTPVEKAPKSAGAKTASKAEAVDDIGLIGGVGQALTKKLNAAGVTSLKQIAGWTEADIAKYDAELNLRGRIARDGWVNQAKELLAGNPPGAKADKAKEDAKEKAKKRD